MIIEACVETAAEAWNAERLGATQLELCADLDYDGLTPGIELIREVTSTVTIPVKVMVRPRAGNFIFTRQEIRQMLLSIELFQSEKIAGLVTGVLSADGTVDLQNMRKLVNAAGSLPVTFHKAVDLVKDPLQAMNSLFDSGISSILTSGGAPTAMMGKGMICAMQEQAGKRIQIIAAGRITQGNLQEVHHAISCGAYHGRRIVGDLSGSTS